MAEGQFPAVRELAQQLDLIIDQQQRLGISVQDITSDERQEVMFRQDRLIQGYMKLSRKIDPSIALALAIQSRLWGSLDDVTTLWTQSPWCSSDEFDYSFEQYASRRTGRDPVTLTNWIRTARLWLIDKIGPTEDVALVDPKTGQFLLEQTDGETRPIMKEWDPFNVDFTKLLLCNRMAREGKLDDVGFGLLANPETRWSDIRDYIHGLLPWERTPIEEPHELSYFIQAGMLWVRKGGMSEVIGSLEWTSENMLVREGISKLVRTFNITVIV